MSRGSHEQVHNFCMHIRMHSSDRSFSDRRHQTITIDKYSSMNCNFEFLLDIQT